MCSSPGEGSISPSVTARPVSGKKKRRRKSGAGDQLASSPVGLGTAIIHEDTPSPPSSPVEKGVERITKSPIVPIPSFDFKGQTDGADIERKNTSGKAAWSATRSMVVRPHVGGGGRGDM